jgi:tetratricopeptide (TPR) repeat protein
MAEEARSDSAAPRQEKLEALFKEGLAFAKANQKAIAFAIGVFVLAAALIAGFVYFQRQAEHEAQALLGKTIAAVEQARRNQAEEGKYIEIKEDFQEIVEEYGATDAGKAAMLTYADFAFRAGDYDTAVEMYQRALEAYENRPVIENLVLNGLAYAHEARGEYQRAAEYLERIVSDETAPLKDQALFNLGRVYEEMEKTDRMRQAYERLVEEFPESLYYELAREALAG